MFHGASASKRAVADLTRSPAPAELAGVFLFLASDGALPLTGRCLSASHGEVMA